LALRLAGHDLRCLLDALAAPDGDPRAAKDLLSVTDGIVALILTLHRAGN
jgi:hypothetical protein